MVGSSDDFNRRGIYGIRKKIARARLSHMWFCDVVGAPHNPFSHLSGHPANLGIQYGTAV
ncbi:hypothetical protein RRF57_001688 [Xylaria bambusicola]|uniref:Uncharacterized protein n=1 Tax=Xylaria bambusicola TaxID=326684 RepID=A0AAN7Z1T5_9PEZI